MSKQPSDKPPVEPTLVLTQGCLLGSLVSQKLLSFAVDDVLARVLISRNRPSLAEPVPCVKNYYPLNRNWK